MTSDPPGPPSLRADLELGLHHTVRSSTGNPEWPVFLGDYVQHGQCLPNFANHIG